MQYLNNWLQTQQHQRNLETIQQLAMAQGSPNINAQFGGMNLAFSPPLSTHSMNNNRMRYDGNILPQFYGSSLPLQQPMQIQTPNRYRRPQNMVESHIMMPLDLLTDNRNLYSVMPYCTGGELFDILEKKNRFSEPEARFWMRQILQVSTNIRPLEQR